MPLALSGLPSLSVDLTVNTVIEKATLVITALEASEINYDTALSGSILRGAAKHPIT